MEGGTPAWVAAVEAWTGGRAAHRETRPWSTVWTVSVGGRTLWFKENCPPHRAEAAVHAALAPLAPEHVDAPVSIEPGRGWRTRSGRW